MDINGGSKFVPGPLPNHSLAPSKGPDALYSGILECPITDRIEKTIKGGEGYNSTFSPTLFQCNSNITSCAHAIGSARDCFDAAQAAVGKATTVETAQGASDTMASGCTLTYDGTGGAKAFFNTKTTKKCCGAGVKSLKGKAASLVEVTMSVTNATSTISLTERRLASPPQLSTFRA